MNRCVNIDWLEVYCLENIEAPRNAQFFRARGFKVKEREYGTPQYREMFTIYDSEDFPQFEVRRNPYSVKENGGIFLPNACHIRLSNRACYKVSPIDDLRAFLISNAYNYQTLSRIDICLDFNVFDSGETPKNFIKKYTKEEISKINQSAFYQFGKDISNIYMHGRDAWNERIINSLKWGSDTSSITTKMYNKSLELQQVKDKFYIRDAWKEAGLRENEVWRIEFSLNSSFKILEKKEAFESSQKYFALKAQETDLHNLCNYDTREKLLRYFHILAAKYFQFRNKDYTKNGKVKPKNRCSIHTTFKISPNEKAYEPKKLTKQKEPTKVDKMLIKRLEELIDSKDTSVLIKRAAMEVAQYLATEKRLKEKRFKDALIMSYEVEKPKVTKILPYQKLSASEIKEIWTPTKKQIIDLWGEVPKKCPF